MDYGSIHFCCQKHNGPEGAVMLDDGSYFLPNYLSVVAGFALLGEGDLARSYCIEGVVLTNLHILTRLNLGATLTHNDLARLDRLAITELHPKILGV